MTSSSSRALNPRKQPAQARSRATVEAILEAAARVFATRGYAGGTTNHIAERAGVSVGSLYEYFPNKDALLVALMEAHIEEGARLLEAASARLLTPPTPLQDAVTGFVQVMIELHARDRRLHRVLFEETPLPLRVRRRLEAVEHAVAERLARYLATQPDVRTPDPALAARVLVQTIEALTHRLIIHGEAEAHPAQAAEMVTLVMAYLTAER